MYARALALFLALTGAWSAVPSGTAHAAKEVVHDHRGVKKPVRRIESPSYYRTEELEKGLKSAFGGESSKPPEKKEEKKFDDYKSKYSDYKGSEWKSKYDDHGYGEYKSWKKETPKFKGVVVKSGSETGLQKYKVRPSIFGSADEKGDDKASRVSEKLGILLAEKELPLATGGGNGVPHAGAKAHHEKGGYGVGFVQMGDAEAHAESGRPVDSMKVMYTTNTGKGPGTIEREAPLAQQSNAHFVVGGRLGSLGEVLASLYEPGVIAFVNGTGGLADSAMKKVLPYLGPLPKHTRVLEGSADNLHSLVSATLAELDKIPGAKDFPKKLVKPGGQAVFSEATKIKEKFTGISFLVHDTGMSDTDLGKLRKLVNLSLTTKLEGRPHVIIVPKREGLSDRIAQAAQDVGISSFEISHTDGERVVESAPKSATNKTVRTTVNLGKGDGVGEFASQREVVQDARAVFVAGGDYKTLTGLIFAMHEKTIIGVLETGGMSGKLQSDILKDVGKDVRAKVIYDTDPVRLYQKVKDALADQDKPKYMSFDSKGWD